MNSEPGDFRCKNKTKDNCPSLITFYRDQPRSRRYMQRLLKCFNIRLLIQSLPYFTFASQNRVQFLYYT